MWVNKDLFSYTELMYIVCNLSRLENVGHFKAALNFMVDHSANDAHTGDLIIGGAGWTQVAGEGYQKES